MGEGGIPAPPHHPSGLEGKGLNLPQAPEAPPSLPEAQPSPAIVPTGTSTPTLAKAIHLHVFSFPFEFP